MFWEGSVLQRAFWRSLGKLEQVNETYQITKAQTHSLLVCDRKGLTPRQVLEIYSIKCTGKNRRLGASIARSYGVSPKAVRDIWNGATWGELTSSRHSATIKSEIALFLNNEFEELLGNVRKTSDKVCDFLKFRGSMRVLTHSSTSNRSFSG